VAQLEQRLAQLLQNQARRRPPTSVAPSPAAPSDYPFDRLDHRFLGDSSGMAFIRAAVDLARSQGVLGYIPKSAHSEQDGAVHLHNLSSIMIDPTQSIQPSRVDSEALFNVFDRIQIQYSVINAREFRQCLDSYYDLGPQGSPQSIAIVNMVFALSLYTLGRRERNSTALKRADSYYEQTLALLHQILPLKGLDTLQVILLILQFSLANPQQPVLWHLLGSALRMSTTLGLHNSQNEDGEIYDYQTNLRRRLFWSLYGIDRAVGNTLGR
jgi:hypothetical protein